MLSTRDALIVGASDVGRATALRLAKDGTNVAIVDPNPQLAEGTADAVRALGVTCEIFSAPLSDPVDAQRIAMACEDAGLNIDILINAQITADWSQSIEREDFATWQNALSVNLSSPFVWAQATLPTLKRTGTGAIVNVGSVDGLFGNVRAPGYSVGKGGLIALTHLMASEFATYPVRANLVARVGSDESLAHFKSDPDEMRYIEQLRQATPLKRLMKPHEAAEPIAFLAGAGASYITGATLVVDGGRTSYTAGTLPLG